MIALDTNILIYACDKADPKRQQVALDLVRSAADGVLLWQVACEFVAASRKLRYQGFRTVDAWNSLADYQAMFPLVVPTPGSFERARILHADQGWSFWDAMIVAASLECGATRLYSEDLPGRILRGPLEIVNPFRQPSRSRRSHAPSRGSRTGTSMGDRARQPEASDP
jgi:predicted nucleic acid-binding protein